MRSFPFLLVLSTAILMRSAFADARLSGRWLGQDGHDFVGYSSRYQGNDVQDLGIALTGLAPGEIRYIRVTGEGSGEWKFAGPENSWAIKVLREPGAPDARLYFEPYQRETGRPFHVEVTYADGTKQDCDVKGGPADPNLRMPSAKLKVEWVGQDGHDWTGPTAAVGPDGFEDVHLVLSQLSAAVEIRSARLTLAGDAWQFGTNPPRERNAELFRRKDDPTKADLFFSPAKDAAGQALTVSIDYANGKSDSAQVIAGEAEAHKSMPVPPEIRPVEDGVTARWIGQTSTGSEVEIELQRPAASRRVRDYCLTDDAGALWVCNVDPNAKPFLPAAWQSIWKPRPMSFESGKLRFPPFRDESGTKLTLRIEYDDGSFSLHAIDGGACDPLARQPLKKSLLAKVDPGADLQIAVDQHPDVLHLAAGLYSLHQPLMLDRPITIEGEIGAVIEFAQSNGASVPWPCAIGIRASGTSLRNVSIRFASPIRWKEGGSVVRAEDAPGQQDARRAIALDGVDLEGAPLDPKQAAAPGQIPPEEPHLVDFGNAESGRVVRCRLKGGSVIVQNGPWEITDNWHRGAVAGCVTYDAFAGHWTHDLHLQRNRVEPDGPAGKLWRFCTLTQAGSHDVIADNVVRGVGLRDNDPFPNPNAPEILLTEAYHVEFEGKPSRTSPDGRIVQIPTVMGDWVVHQGSVLAVVSEANASAKSRSRRWTTVAQVLSPTTFVLTDPIPPDTSAVSLCDGFVNETFEGNDIDVRGSTHAADFVLAGNHFGARVVNNRLAGGRQGLLLDSVPSETPNIWGWTHCPVLDLTCTGNTITDALRPVEIALDQGPAAKTTTGRVYLTGVAKDNAVNYSAEFTRAHPNSADVVPSRIEFSESQK